MKNKSKRARSIILNICIITLFLYLINNKSISLGTIIIKSISVPNINDSIIIGSEYTLPSHVKGILQNGTEKEASVVWTPAKPDTSKPGTFDFIGKIKGYKGNVKLVLNVKRITSVADYKAAIYQGENLSFPAVVKADIDDGTNREVNVNWNSTKIDSSKTGIFNVEGSVNGYDKKVNLKVLVLSKTDKERNITVEQKKIKRVPVLMYHYIEDYNDKDEYKELKVSKEKFKKQLQYLKDNGYSTLTLNEIYDFIVNHKCIPEKSVALTFDDGYNDNYTNAFPLIKEYGYKATVFVVTNWIDKEGLPYISSEHLKEMDTAGMDIESHTLNHDHLPTLSYDK
ncbi:MAG: Ig-like domain-containing protein, partial [Bacillota bacterium]|nr:Ig-like domain-containing protein [Bacillota bacterium]